jgi:hypothetical protein
LLETSPLVRVGKVPARLRWEARTLIGMSPTLALAALRRRKDAFLQPVGEQTEVVIDGFPRSANTFALIAFTRCQSGEVQVAHHVHLPAQIVEAARRSLPTIVLIREPEEAISSLLLRLPELSVRQGMRSYLRYYRPLLRHRGSFVVGRFDEVTTDFGKVIRRTNQRFGTEFTEFDHTDENVQRVFDLIERWDRGRLGAGEAFRRSVARPSSDRRAMMDQIRKMYRHPRLARKRRRLQSLFDSFAGGSLSQRSE